MTTARSLAADMVEEVGWLLALDAALDLVWTATSWSRWRQALRLLIAVTFA